MKFPRDLVAIDTLDIRPLLGSVQRVPAGDLISRSAFTSLYTQAPANSARKFLEEFLRKSPFPVKTIQCDGGSEFSGKFEGTYQEYGLKLFVLPPWSPKPNGVVERLNRIFREEFWTYYEEDVGLETLQFHLQRWTEEVYGGRPHWSLGRGAWEYLKDTGLCECPT